MGLKNFKQNTQQSAFSKFFSQEAGQERTAWLNRGFDKFNRGLGQFLGPQVMQTVDEASNFVEGVSPLDDYQYAVSGANKMVGAKSLSDFAAGGLDLATGVASFALPTVAAGMFPKATQAGIEAVAGSRPARAVDSYLADEAGSVGRTNTDIIEGLTPAQQMAHDVQNLLMLGRGDEVTKEMYAAMDRSYFLKHSDIATDAGSRVARRDADSYEALFHNTDEKNLGMDYFDVDKNRYGVTKGTGVWTNTSREAAETYGGRGRETMELYGRNENQYSVNFKRNDKLSAGRSHPMQTPDGVVDAREGLPLSRRVSPMRTDAAAQNARKLGASSQRQANVTDPGRNMFTHNIPKGDNVVYFDATQLRDKDAMFDSRLKHLPNLLAGTGGAAFTLDQLTAEQSRRGHLNELLAEQQRRNGT